MPRILMMLKIKARAPRKIEGSSSLSGQGAESGTEAADFRASSGAAGPKVERSRGVESVLIGHKVEELPELKGAFLDAWCSDVIAPHAMPEYRRNATRRMLEYFIDALVAGHPEGRVE